jgi:hypothetical protein
VFIIQALLHPQRLRYLISESSAWVRVDACAEPSMLVDRASTQETHLVIADDGLWPAEDLARAIRTIRNARPDVRIFLYGCLRNAQTAALLGDGLADVVLAETKPFSDVCTTVASLAVGSEVARDVFELIGGRLSGAATRLIRPLLECPREYGRVGEIARRCGLQRNATPRMFRAAGLPKPGLVLAHAKCAGALTYNAHYGSSLEDVARSFLCCDAGTLWRLVCRTYSVRGWRDAKGLGLLEVYRRLAAVLVEQPHDLDSERSNSLMVQNA